VILRFDVATFLCLQLSDKQKCACVDSWKSTIESRSGFQLQDRLVRGKDEKTRIEAFG
jgi:hypothetical protein